MPRILGIPQSHGYYSPTKCDVLYSTRSQWSLLVVPRKAYYSPFNTEALRPPGRHGRGLTSCP